MRELRELQDVLAREIVEEQNREMAELEEAHKVEQKASQKRLTAAVRELSAAGLPLEAIEALDQRLALAAEKETGEIEKALIKGSEQESLESELVGFEDDVALGKQVRRLTSAWSGTFSTPADNKSTGAPVAAANLALSSRAVLSGSCKDWYVWARGIGSGFLGSGARRVHSNLDFGFWFRPRSTRYYSVIPRFRFRGFYILRADDSYLTSKKAKVSIDCSTRVWQHGWKPWSTVRVLGEGSQNINRNRRFDVDRNTYQGALLGGGDWAYIHCRIGLDAYARGRGSFAKLDFASGSANYLCVPWVVVS